MTEGLQPQATPATAPPPAAALTPGTPGAALRKDIFGLLTAATEALASLPADHPTAPELEALARATRAGPVAARGIIEVAGGAAVASALMQASALFRSTGHFRRSDVLERLAFVVAGWERRARPRRR